MKILITLGVPRKLAALPSNDNLVQLKTLSPVEGYAVRRLAQRAGVTLAHAVLAAELAGIIREGAHG